jgi:hypothetical protein
MSASLLLNSSLLLIGMASCDTYYSVSARAPMIEPLDPACLRSSFVRLTGQGVAHVQRQGPDREQMASITYSTASYRTNLAQVVRRDSSVYLVAEFGRVHQEHPVVRGMVRPRNDCPGIGSTGNGSIPAAGRHPRPSGWYLCRKVQLGLAGPREDRSASEGLRGRDRLLA